MFSMVASIAACGEAVAPGDSGTDGDAGDGAACETGTQCGEVCVDLTSDPDHCGRCDNECPDGTNAHGVCTPTGCALECNTGWADPGDDGVCEYECTASVPPDEDCDDVDDDCDGYTDDGFDCRLGSDGACATS